MPINHEYGLQANISLENLLSSITANLNLLHSGGISLCKYNKHNQKVR